MSNETWKEERDSAIEEHVSDTLTNLTVDVLMHAEYSAPQVVAMGDQDLRDRVAVNFGHFLKEHWESIRFDDIRARFQRVIDLGLADESEED